MGEQALLARRPASSALACVGIWASKARVSFNSCCAWTRPSLPPQVSPRRPIVSSGPDNGHTHIHRARAEVCGTLRAQVVLLGWLPDGGVRLLGLPMVPGRRVMLRVRFWGHGRHRWLVWSG